MSRRALTFAAIAVCCVGGAGAYLLHAVRRTAPAADGTQISTRPRQGSDPDAVRLLSLDEALPTWPLLVFRRASIDEHNGRLGVAPVADPASPRLVTTLRCERVHMAGDKGVCLTADRGVFTTYRAVLFDRTFKPWAELPLAGVPSRVQVAPDGRLAATTVFVSGHSYASGAFSTRTSIVDLESGRWLVEDLETFTIRREGQPISSADFNLWGVTFTPDSRNFYATLGTGNETLLIKGDVEARTADVVDENVECPSSPDGRRVAFKLRDGGVTGPVTWRLWVLDLQTRQRHPLAETRNVDDQVQWLDNDNVLYALPGGADRAAIMDEWVVPADGGGQPRLFLPQAYSVAVARAARS